MIVLALLLISATADQSTDAETAADIVVTAERLRKVRWSFHSGPAGQLKDCKVTRPSGDPLIDTTVCDATRQCANQGLRDEAAIAICAAPLAKKMVMSARAEAKH